MIIGFDASRGQTPERAGPENYTYNLLENLLRIDKKNFYRLYYNPQASSLKLPLQLPRPTRFATRSGRTAPRFQLRPISWPRLWTQGGLALECLQRPPDVLFIPAHTIPLIRRPGLKTVVTIHDVGLQKFLAQYQRRWWRLYGGRISNYAASRATHVIAVSESTKRDLIEQLGLRADKITVVYEGVDHQKFKIQNSKFETDRVRKKYGIDGDYLLFVGTIQPRKNLVRLVEAFQKTLKILNSQISLVIVGKEGWLADEIFQAPKKFAVEERVKFLGYVPTEDVALLLNGAKAFVFPSLYEGFGLPVLEALACGCPVVTSNISSMPEVVGEAGILVDPYSVVDMAWGLHQVLTMREEERKDTIQRGLRRVRHFSWEIAAQQTLSVLEKI